jgi:hypothetical protein
VDFERPWESTRFECVVGELLAPEANHAEILRID